MSWVGSKARNAEFILAILNDSQYDGMPYLEPFVGMGHVLSRVQRKQSYRASDNCQLLMILLGAVQRGEPLPTITKDEYYALKSRPDSLKKATAAITYSFNGKLFGGCFLHDLEVALYNNGGANGAVHRLLARESLSLTIFCVKKACIAEGTVTATELSAIIKIFQEQLPLESRGRVRMASLIPLPVTAQVCKAYGRSPRSIAWLEAFSQPVPRLWEVQREAEANAENLEWDPLLEDEMQELQEEEVSLDSELKASYVQFKEREVDEQVSRSYTLERIPPALEQALKAYKEYRIAPINRMRNGSACVELTVDSDRSTTLRFLGWLHREHGVTANLKVVFGAANLGQRVEAFVAFLRERECKYSTCANYVSALVNVASFIYETEEVEAHESPTALEQILNLRVQCEKEAKQDHLWKTKDPHFIDFEKAQQARAKAIEECQAYSGGDHKKKFQLVKDCLVLSFLTCQPYFN